MRAHHGRNREMLSNEPARPYTQTNISLCVLLLLIACLGKSLVWNDCKEGATAFDVTNRAGQMFAITCPSHIDIPRIAL